MQKDAYGYWREALEGRFGAITETGAQPGFYRKRGVGGIWLPVAIWVEGDIVWVQIGAEEPNGAGEIVTATWLACAKYPVTEKDYRHAVATGQWLGEAPAAPTAPGIGDNKPPSGFDELATTIATQAAEVEAWLKDRTIESQAEADKCETLANDLLRLKKQAEGEHKAEKEPHLKAGREVDAKYKPLIEKAADWAKRLKNAATSYLIAREKEKQAAAAQAIARGDVAPARTDTRATTSGSSGRKLALRTVRTAHIEDWDAAIGFFKSHPELRELVQRLANKCAQVGAKVPGVRMTEDKVAA
jgi:hypothetical protein